MRRSIALIIGFTLTSLPLTMLLGDIFSELVAFGVAAMFNIGLVMVVNNV